MSHFSLQCRKCGKCGKSRKSLENAYCAFCEHCTDAVLVTDYHNARFTKTGSGDPIRGMIAR